MLLTHLALNLTGSRYFHNHILVCLTVSNLHLDYAHHVESNTGPRDI